MTTSKRVARQLAGTALAAALIALGAASANAQTVTVANLVSDGSVPAVTVDPLLINPWGISYGPGGPFWVSDNNGGASTLYDGTGAKIPLNVAIPPPRGATGSGTPTGQVFANIHDKFKVSNGVKTRAAIFLFATEDGTITGWAPSVDATHALIGVDNSSEAAVYKGLAIGVVGTRNYLYAANFRASDVEMFDGFFRLVRTFTDPTVPRGFSPFNVQNLGGTLYVTFAKTDAQKHDDVAGPGNGFVDAFTLNGAFVRRLVSHGPLNSPWGLDIAPASFGPLAGALLVGNFGDGWINAFDPTTGAYKGPLVNGSGIPIVIGDLWGLINGNGASAGDTTKVYFAAGLQKESHGLFGSLTPVSGGAGAASSVK